MYCLPVMDSEIATQRQTAQEALKIPMPTNQRQQIKDSTAELDRLLVANRQRLAVYAASNGLLTAMDNFGEGVAFLAAKRRGEVDAAQCAAEAQVNMMSCAYPCTRKCTPGVQACFQQCYTGCRMPACARTAACINPTWLPY